MRAHQQAHLVYSQSTICLFRMRPVGLVWKKDRGARSTRSVISAFMRVAALQRACQSET